MVGKLYARGIFVNAVVATVAEDNCTERIDQIAGEMCTHGEAELASCCY